jgi:uncharacterized protein involved in tellurium resistance
VTVDRDPAVAPSRDDLPWLRRRTTRPSRTPPPRPADHPGQPTAPTGNLTLAGPPTGPLDLTPATAPPRPPAPPRPRVPALPPPPRVDSTGTARLTPRSPTVTLDRLQSGVGALKLSLVKAPGAGDLSLGCAYQFTDGGQGVVQRLGGALSAPVAAPSPLLRLDAGPAAETLLVDLRRVRSLRRLLLYGYSPAGSVVSWDGAVIVETYGGARVEAPVDAAPSAGTMALLTVYVVDGEAVLRAEMEPFPGPAEQATRGYGYDLLWLDGRVPPGGR